MDSYSQAVKRSLKIAVIILLANLVGAFSSILLGFSPYEVFGNLLLVETATLFIIAGVLDFGSSAGIAKLREIIFHSKEGFSPTKRKENELGAVTFIIAGLILMIIMILITVVDLSSRGM